MFKQLLIECSDLVKIAKKIVRVSLGAIVVLTLAACMADAAPTDNKTPGFFARLKQRSQDKKQLKNDRRKSAPATEAKTVTPLKTDRRKSAPATEAKTVTPLKTDRRKSTPTTEAKTVTPSAKKTKQVTQVKAPTPLAEEANEAKSPLAARRDELFEKMAEFGKQIKLSPSQYTERMIVNRLYMVFEELTQIEEAESKLQAIQSRLKAQIKAGLEETNASSFASLQRRSDLSAAERAELVKKAQDARNEYEMLDKQYNIDQRASAQSLDAVADILKGVDTYLEEGNGHEEEVAMPTPQVPSSPRKVTAPTTGRPRR